jgi:hypothetical protein
MEVEDFDTYCQDCFPKVSKKSEHSTRATAALVCGIIGLNACIFLAVPAIVLGHMEIAAIDRGESPFAGRNLAKGGMILGYIGTALSVLLVLIFLVAFIGAASRHY